MARRAGKHDGLDVMATAIKREQKKSAKQDKKRASAKAAKAAKKRILTQTPVLMNRTSL